MVGGDPCFVFSILLFFCQGNAPPSYHEEPSDQPMFRTPGDIFRRPVLLHSSEDSDDCAGEKDAKTVSGVQEEAKEWAEIGEKSVRWDPVLEHCQSPPPPDCTAESSKTSAAAPEVCGFCMGVVILIVNDRHGRFTTELCKHSNGEQASSQ